MVGLVHHPSYLQRGLRSSHSNRSFHKCQDKVPLLILRSPLLALLHEGSFSASTERAKISPWLYKDKIHLFFVVVVAL